MHISKYKARNYQLQTNDMTFEEQVDEMSQDLGLNIEKGWHQYYNIMPSLFVFLREV